MTATLERPTTSTPPSNGGLPARRAVVRWAWRLFRREWRQQFLILAMVTVAVAATILGGTVAVDTRQPSTFGFGTAQDLATYEGSSPHVASELASLRHRFGTVEVIEDQTLAVPGSIDVYHLRSQRPDGPFGAPLLSLVSGHYPTRADEVAVTAGVATTFHLKVGGIWRQGPSTRRVVGTVQNPQSLLDEFALVTPGQVTEPTQVTALFDAHGVKPSAIGPTVQTPASVAASNPINPETISVAALVLGMLLIALVSVGGFTVLAQRRLRSIGLLESLGATDRHVALVVKANGIIVGLVGAVVGLAVSLVAWLAYRPTLEQSSHHLIGVLQLPWLVVALSMLLAVVATYFAASRPARAITHTPIVAALSGRPAPPRKVHRSAVPGIVLLVIAFLSFGVSGSTGGNGNGGGGGGLPFLLGGLLTLVPGLILLAPFCLSFVALVGGRAPIAARLALSDLARFRARSGSALAAISIGVLIAVIISLAAAVRYGNVLDYAGPNLTTNQLVLHAQPPPLTGVPGSAGKTGVELRPQQRTAQSPPATSPATAAQMAASAQRMATSLNGRLIALESTDVVISHPTTGRSWDGHIYVGTPQLLRAFGIKRSAIASQADILTSRPGLSNVSGLYLRYGGNLKYQGQLGTDPNVARDRCTAARNCLPNPVIQQMDALPTGTAAPNTVITEHAMAEFHLQVTTSDWLIQRTQPFTAAQISTAQLSASTAQLAVESKDDQPTSSEVINWATAFGILLALGILTMSVGLIRSETAGDMATLAATGASSYTRRTLTAVTAGALGFLGALLGTAGGYIALIGWLRSNSLNGGIAALTNVPVANLLFILVGMPVLATVVGWLLAGREASDSARRPS